MRNKHVWISGTLSVFAVLVAISCGGGGGGNGGGGQGGDGTAPTISYVDPSTGAVGTKVTINGTNFSTTASNNTVKFNNMSAAVTSSTASSITTSVPMGATTGPISVTVDGLTATSATNFTVTSGIVFASTDVPKSIPDNDSVTGASSTITVSSGPTSITKVRVIMLNITHTNDQDLRFYLKAPDGTLILLSSYNGGTGDNYSQTYFDDSASTLISSAAAPFWGPYRPEQALSALNGKNSNGTWTLRVYDDTYYDHGSLTGWSLEIQ